MQYHNLNIVFCVYQCLNNVLRVLCKQLQDLILIQTESQGKIPITNDKTLNSMYK